MKRFDRILFCFRDALPRTGSPLLLLGTAILTLLLPALSQAAEPEIRSGVFDGTERTWRLYIPDGLPDDAPLVFVLHGYGGSFDLDRRGFNAVADSCRFAVCYPQGSKDARGKNCWNVGYPFQSDMTVDDVSFLRQLAARLQAEHRLSSRNTFCTGMSNGGEMCYLLAFAAPETFAAVAPIAGLMMKWIYLRYEASEPVPLFEIHGTADRTSEWMGDDDNRGGWGEYLPVPTAVGYWVAADRCTRYEVDTLPRRRNRVIAHRHSGGRLGSEVWLYEIEGGGHSWAADDIDTPAEIWRFFSKFLKY